METIYYPYKEYVEELKKEEQELNELCHEFEEIIKNKEYYTSGPITELVEKLNE